MATNLVEVPLGRNRLGTRRTLDVHRFGEPGARPKTYIQAGLHANEIPPMLVAHHLVRRLAEADARGLIAGEIVVVPVANPIGFDQVHLGELIGRFALDGSGNFNRDFPDLTQAAADLVRGRLGPDARANVDVVRKALVQALAALTPRTPVDALRHALLGLAVDADIVLDLHCDGESVMHLYTGAELWPDAADLAAEVGARAVLLADVSGGDPFDEACSSVWWKLRTHLGEHHPIPAACLAATMEYRGRTDVEPALGPDDADRMFRFLQRRGVIAGDPGPLPAVECDATPLAGVERLVAHAPGIVVYHRQPGDRVVPGDLVAELVEPGHAVVPMRAGPAGLFYARMPVRLAAPGDVIGSIAGPNPLTGREGHLLED